MLVGTAALSIKDHFATPLSTGWGGEGPLIGIALHAHTADQLIRLANGETRNPVPLPRLVDDVAIWVAAYGWRGAGAARVARACSASGADTGPWSDGWRHRLGIRERRPVAARRAGGAGLGAECGRLQLCHALGLGLRERTQLRRSFESYLDPRIINQMMQGETLPSFGGEHREITVIFTDIAYFTTTAETMDAATVAGLLGDYFGVLTDVVVQNGGLVNDFIGDGLLVTFGAPMHQPDHADRAVATALAMNETAQRFNAGLAARGIKWGHTRIRSAYRHGAGRQYRHSRQTEIRRARRYAEHRLPRGRG